METKAEDIRAIIDERLEQLGHDTAALENLKQIATAEVDAVLNKYSQEIADLEHQIKHLDKDVKSLAKKNKAIVFDGKDQVTLDHGILLWGKEKKVSIPRDALDKIEARGWNEAIKIAKSVDRSVVEKWPVERLTVIGAERKTVEKFSYEIKTANGSQ
jgi:phage host-nuclease inhibitor protein Gam